MNCSADILQKSVCGVKFCFAFNEFLYPYLFFYPNYKEFYQIQKMESFLAHK